MKNEASGNLPAVDQILEQLPQGATRVAVALKSEVCEGIAGKRLAQTGEGGSMANAYFNQAYGPLRDAVERYTL